MIKRLLYCKFTLLCIYVLIKIVDDITSDIPVKRSMVLNTATNAFGLG